MKVSSLISSMEKQLEEIKEKDSLSSKERSILNYILSFISFRLQILSNNKADLEAFNTIKKEEESILELLSKKQLKALNQLILYQDLQREKIRKEDSLRQLKNKLMSKIE